MKSIFEQMGGTYTEVNGYLIPDIEMPSEESKIGIWGQRHLEYIKEWRKGFYSELMLNGKLNAYLADIDEHAKTMYDRLMKQLIEQEGITEQLKAENQMLWVGKMNAIHNAATEIVDNELIFN